MKKNDLIEVLWLDTTQDPSWKNETETAKEMPSLCRSLGYFLNRDKRCLRISESLNVTLNQRSVQVIPVGTILKVRKLR